MEKKTKVQQKIKTPYETDKSLTKKDKSLTKTTKSMMFLFTEYRRAF